MLACKICIKGVPRISSQKMLENIDFADKVAFSSLPKGTTPSKYRIDKIKNKE